MKRNYFFQKVLAAVLAIAALVVGQGSAQATTKTVTYTMTSVGVEQSGGSNYEVVFTRSGDAPFDASQNTYTCTVPASALSSSGGAGSFSLTLADGFTFYGSWSSGSSVTFTNNCIRITASGMKFKFSLRCPDEYYYVTNVKMTGAEGTWSNLDFDSQWNFRKDYNTAYSFSSLSITYSDVPALSIFESDGENAYKIKSKEDLRHLANYVNNGHNKCDDLTFRQTQDITCDDTYVPIGFNTSNIIYPFQGTFDGQGKTISGITVTRTGNNIFADGFIGLFGYLGSGSIVQNVILAKSTFTGFRNIGGIVGLNNCGTVQNCRVENDVTIKAGIDGAVNLGGIVGYIADGTIIGCVSAASIQNNSMSKHYYSGGIAGYVSSGVQVKDCLYTGSTVEANGYKGAITGFNTSKTAIYTNNYYTNISLGGIGDQNTSSDRDGARRARTVTLGENIALVGDETAYDVSGITVIGTGNYAMRYNNTIYSGEGQTLTFRYTGTVPDGYTACFAVNGNPIEGNTFQMPASDVTVTATFTDQWGIAGDADGSKEHPYIITTTAGLDLLAKVVNGTDGYTANNLEGKFFQLGDNITYTHKAANEAGADTENNYTAIGNNDHAFRGTFDGKDKTISGIRIYKGGTDNADSYQGLFGQVHGGTIKNVTLTDADITGNQIVGGIVGYMSEYNGTDDIIENCHVTSSVVIRAAVDMTLSHGGIVGDVNIGFVSGCTSAATLTMAEGLKECNEYGGIVGSLNGTVSDCLYTGTISGVNSVGGIAGLSCEESIIKDCLVSGANITATENLGGAIVGENDSFYEGYKAILTHNYYSGCTLTINGTTATTNIGCGCKPPEYFVTNTPTDVTEMTFNGVTYTDGAVPAIVLVDNTDNSSGIAKNTGSGKNVILYGRTLYTDGAWNTLCLPFAVSTASGPLSGDGVTAMTLNTSTSNLNGSTLTLNFTSATSIPAGTPFIIKWENTGEDIENPVFTGVTISGSASTEVSFTGGKFKGTFDPVSFNSEDKSVLFLGGGNKLYYPDGTATTNINAFRAYFQLNGVNNVKEFRLKFGEEDEATPLLSPEGEDNGASPRGGLEGGIYDLSGRLVNSSTRQLVNSLKKGIYIYNGKKTVIK